MTEFRVFLRIVTSFKLVPRGVKGWQARGMQSIVWLQVSLSFQVLQAEDGHFIW